MTLRSTPASAENIIRFDGAPGRSSVVGYDVSTPGRYRGQRLLRLDLDIAPDKVEEGSAAVTSSVAALAWTERGGTYTYDAVAARELWFAKLDEAADVTTTSGADVISIMRQIAMEKPLTPSGALDPVSSSELWDHVSATFPEHFEERPPGWGPQPSLTWRNLPALATCRRLTGLYREYVDGLSVGRLVLPTRNLDNGLTTESTLAADVLSTSTDDAHFFLVEVFGISSFLGSYGLGRTVRTFTLLPGEETRITMKTWRTDTSKVAEATSIVDSYDEKSASRFNSTVQRETTDKSTRNSKRSWHAEAEVQARWGWGDAKVRGGMTGDTQAGREQFSKNITNAVKEHSAEAASNRKNSVTLSTELDTVVGQESATERTIRNVNLRRVLNFVFRELNQEYTTVVHLMEVKVAFATSTTDSYREVSIAGLRPLLEDVLKPEVVDEAAARILAIAGTVTGHDGEPVRTLERLTVRADGSYLVEPAAPSDAGEWLPPPEDGQFLYRWKRGPLAQAERSPHRVEGVVMDSTTLVMPTADLVVEALLGEADALDDYAMASQFEEAHAKALDNRRMALALDTLEAIPDPVARAEAWAKVFPPPTAE